MREHLEHRDQPLISLSFDEDISDRQIDVIETFLLTVYEELNKCSMLQSDESDRSFAEYRHWCYLHAEGAQRRKRLSCIRHAVHTKLEATDDVCTFLILDGIDRCDPTIRYTLETELADLQRRKVKILLTSRSATFEQRQALCDYECIENNPLDMYLQCRNTNCEGFTLCFVCKDSGRMCDKW